MLHSLTAHCKTFWATNSFFYVVTKWPRSGTQTIAPILSALEHFFEGSRTTVAPFADRFL